MLRLDSVTRVKGAKPTMLRYNQHVFRTVETFFSEENENLCWENFAILHEEFGSSFAMHCPLYINFDTGDFIEQLTLFVPRDGML